MQSRLWLKRCGDGKASGGAATHGGQFDVSDSASKKIQGLAVKLLLRRYKCV